MRVLLLTPPSTQLNTPYPATAVLAGVLRAHTDGRQVEVTQADPALELFLRLFSRPGLVRVLVELRGAGAGGRAAPGPRSPAVAHLLGHAEVILDIVEPVIRFLQGRDPTLALRIGSRAFLPEGPRFAALGGAGEGQGGQEGEPIMGWAFGALGTTDRARHLASLFVDDLADAVRDGVDERFTLARYGESLASSAPSFDPLQAALDGPPTLVDHLVDEIADELGAAHRPDLVGLSVPFPGNVYGALRMARALRRARPGLRVVLGGGYVNTELRGLKEPRLFDFVDYVTLDDGARPLLALVEHLRSGGTGPLLRTFVRHAGQVVWKTDPGLNDVALRDAGTPTYAGLPLDRYVSLFEMLNPMHRLWSDGRWNKLVVAHGCYWKKCTFCDVSLDYIGRYELAGADLLVDRILALVQETGQTGFHFVDEAAPPAALRALAERLLARGVVISWWGNVRFEKAFTPELALLLGRAGCVALSGGLEVADDRLLDLMQKGVSVAQVARVTHALAEAGIMVHAYLMYGFPTQTVQETVDALERVRQLFAAGCLQSAFWHRFAATAHSPIGLAPGRFGIRLRPAPRPTFAHNGIAFDDPTGVDHDTLGRGLRRALYNYMHGLGLEADVRTWFESPKGPGIPPTTVDLDLVRSALPTAGGAVAKGRAKVPAGPRGARTPAARRTRARRRSF